MSLFEAIQRSWQPSKTALVSGDERITFAELQDRVGRTRTWLLTRGIGRGDVVAVQLGKQPAFLDLFLATVSLGAVFLPLHGDAPQAEVDALTEAAGAAITVRLRPRLAGLTRTPPVVQSPDTEAVRLHTSGTTGRPKGVPLTHGNILATVTALHEAWQWQPTDVLLHTLPLHHVHGLFVAQLGALHAGATTVWLPRFGADTVLHTLPMCTVYMGVPTHYHRLLQQPELDHTDLSKMRLFTSGSAPLPAQEHRAFARRTGHEIVERYGMTEVGIVLSNPLDGPRRPGRVGHPLPGVRARIVKPGTEEHVNDDEVGMLHIKGPSVFGGYHNRPDATAAVLLPGGWMRTGDLASRATDGSIRIVGRQDDLILTGGYNVYPAEVEAALCEQDGVDEAGVYGVTDPDLGQVLHADIVGDVDFERLANDLREVLSRYKVPRHFHRVDALPRNAMGKVVRARLGSHGNDAG